MGTTLDEFHRDFIFHGVGIFEIDVLIDSEVIDTKRVKLMALYFTLKKVLEI